MGLKEILRVIDNEGILILKKSEGLKLLNKMLMIFNETSIRINEGRRGFKTIKIIINFREEWDEWINISDLISKISL